MTTAMSTVPVAPGRLPLLGHALALARDPLGFLLDLRTRGDIVTFYLGPRPVQQINAPELIRQVLVTDAHRFDRGKVYQTAREYFGDGLATADGPTHLRQRRTMQPAFHPGRIPGYGTVMREQIESIVDSWEPGKRIRLDHEMTELALTVTAKALFRTDFGQAAVDEVRRSLGPILNGITARSLMPFRLLERLPTPGNRRFSTALHRLVSIVDELIAEYIASGTDHGDLLSMLVATRGEDQAPALSPDEIRAQVLNILMAGTETTATALAWVFYELASNPEVERLVQQEVDTVGRGGAAGTLPYVDRVLNETIRRHTPVWLLMRTANDTVQLGGLTVAAGTEVMIGQAALHRDPELFGDPLSFDPDRWLDPAAKEWGRSRFIPFGGGAHKCIGDHFAWVELTTVVATVCARWSLAIAPGAKVREVTRAFLRPNALPMIPQPRSA